MSCFVLKLQKDCVEDKMFSEALHKKTENQYVKRFYAHCNVAVKGRDLPVFCKLDSLFNIMMLKKVIREMHE